MDTFAENLIRLRPICTLISDTVKTEGVIRTVSRLSLAVRVLILVLVLVPRKQLEDEDEHEERREGIMAYTGF